MPWIKKGLIFKNSGEYFWNKTHAQGPFVDCLNEAIWRIYYNTRDGQNHTRTSYIEVEAGNPQNVLYVHDKPILEPGSNGSFDDCGSMGTCIVNLYNKKFMYYIGWNVRNTVSYHLSLGLATSRDGVHFKKMFAGPILDRFLQEGYLCTSCYVLTEQEKWKMWYTSGEGYVLIQGQNEPRYNIKYAESIDGILWNRKQQVSIACNNEHEAIGVPSVIKEKGIYKMWYSYRDIENYRTNRNASYRIGYAESKDGIKFVRKDGETGIDISEKKDDWDSEMIAYGKVIIYNGKKYMFYNGNGFGKTGIGYAVFEN